MSKCCRSFVFLSGQKKLTKYCSIGNIGSVWSEWLRVKNLHLYGSPKESTKCLLRIQENVDTYLPFYEGPGGIYQMLDICICMMSSEELSNCLNFQLYGGP